MTGTLNVEQRSRKNRNLSRMVQEMRYLHRLCPRKVLDKDEDGYPVVKEMDLCTGCKLCANRCPDFAITVYSGEKDNEKTENIERSCE